MSKIGLKIQEPILKYYQGEIDKEQFKQQIRQIEQNTSGANWHTISAAASKEIQNFDKKDKDAVMDALREIYPKIP